MREAGKYECFVKGGFGEGAAMVSQVKVRSVSRWGRYRRRFPWG